MTEAELQSAVTDACLLLGLAVFHPYDSRRSTGSGYPDLTIVGSSILWAELKSADGRMSRDQIRWRDRILNAGGTYCVWRPADLADGTIMAELRRLRKL